MAKLKFNRKPKPDSEEGLDPKRHHRANSRELAKKNFGGAVTTIKLTEEKAEIIIEAVRAGNFIETAAAMAGLSADLVRKYMSVGQQELEEALQEVEDGLASDELMLTLRGRFYVGVQAAMANYQATALKGIDMAGKMGVWQALAWRLEKLFPDQFGKKAQQVVEHKHEIKILAEPVKRLESDDAFTAMVAADRAKVVNAEFSEVEEEDED